MSRFFTAPLVVSLVKAGATKKVMTTANVPPFIIQPGETVLVNSATAEHNGARHTVNIVVKNNGTTPIINPIPPNLVVEARAKAPEATKKGNDNQVDPVARGTEAEMEKTPSAEENESRDVTEVSQNNKLNVASEKGEDMIGVAFKDEAGTLPSVEENQVRKSTLNEDHLEIFTNKVEVKETPELVPFAEEVQVRDVSEIPNENPVQTIDNKPQIQVKSTAEIVPVNSPPAEAVKTTDFMIEVPSEALFKDVPNEDQNEVKAEVVSQDNSNVVFSANKVDEVKIVNEVPQGSQLKVNTGEGQIQVEVAPVELTEVTHEIKMMENGVPESSLKNAADHVADPIRTEGIEQRENEAGDVQSENGPKNVPLRETSEQRIEEGRGTGTEEVNKKDLSGKETPAGEAKDSTLSGDQNPEDGTQGKSVGMSDSQPVVETEAKKSIEQENAVSSSEVSKQSPEGPSEVAQTREDLLSSNPQPSKVKTESISIQNAQSPAEEDS